MRLKSVLIFVSVLVLLAVGWYQLEPWAVTFIDDGPYYSREYSRPVESLPLQSSVELRRFGVIAYTLESRSLVDRNESVLVLRNAAGAIKWTRIPLKPDGELGFLELLRAHVTWYGGWRIRIAPDNQEPGDLYIGALGRFRFFNHSW